MQLLTDFSHEMLVSRHLSGFQLIRPEDATPDQQGALTLGSLLEMPYNVFFFGRDHIIQEVNDACWSSCGFESREHAVGNTVFTVCKDAVMSASLIQNNYHVLKTMEMFIDEEHMLLTNDEFVNAISFKFPWYNNYDSLIGVFGCAILIEGDDAAYVSHHLAMIINQFCVHRPQLQQTPLSLEPGKKYFSSREMEVIKQIMRGKTLREAGLALGLSTRTVEAYFSNIKLKMNVRTKSQFFEKMMNEYLA